MKESLWLTLDSCDGDRQLKQHCFIPKLSRGGKIRNKSLCGNMAVGNDEGKAAIFDEICNDRRGGELVSDNVCKSCYNIYFKTSAIMTQKQFTDFLQANNCLDKYMKNRQESPFRIIEDFETWFEMTKPELLISGAFHYPAGEFSLWIDLNNKYKLFLKEIEL